MDPVEYLGFVRSHLDRLIGSGRADFGPDPRAFWMSSVDIRTGRYPEDDSRPEGIGRRVYRSIDATRGSTLYWDQPQIAAAHAASRLSGDGRYALAADAYVRDFLDRCVARSGLFLWGNHYYWDAFEGCVKKFKGDETPVPVDPGADDGEYHEVRPIRPAWDAFWRVDPVRTERAVRAMGERHVFDADSGGFNRHADGQCGYSFLESGGILAESLSWLAQKTGDASLAELAERVVRFSWEGRSPTTGLVPNQRTRDRWDRRSCTTEVGLWAGSLLRAAVYTGRDSFRSIAHEAVRAYLSYGYDEEAGRYFGRLDVATGGALLGEPDTPYQPGVYADPWRPLFPAHDYPVALATGCVDMASMDDPDGVFTEAVSRWARALAEGTHPGAYAEHYGRAIHFLTHAGWTLARPEYVERARSLADEAADVLFAHGMFRGHPGEDRYDAVDGVGFLLQALLELSWLPGTPHSIGS